MRNGLLFFALILSTFVGCGSSATDNSPDSTEGASTRADPTKPEYAKAPSWIAGAHVTLKAKEKIAVPASMGETSTAAIAAPTRFGIIDKKWCDLEAKAAPYDRWIDPADAVVVAEVTHYDPQNPSDPDESSGDMLKLRDVVDGATGSETDFYIACSYTGPKEFSAGDILDMLRGSFDVTYE
jgi:hypothetical protein